jgi:hypothetical protein
MAVFILSHLLEKKRKAQQILNLTINSIVASNPAVRAVADAAPENSGMTCIGKSMLAVVFPILSILSV